MFPLNSSSGLWGEGDRQERWMSASIHRARRLAKDGCEAEHS